MTEVDDIGSRLHKFVTENNIIMRDLLQRLKQTYPEERGLTENGFRYSMKNGTIKLGLFIKLIKTLGVKPSILVPSLLAEDCESCKEKAAQVQTQGKRIAELERERDQYLKLIDYLEFQIAAIKKHTDFGLDKHN